MICWIFGHFFGTFYLNHLRPLWRPHGDNMETTWGPQRCGDHMGTTWGQHEDNVETMWGQHGDHRDVETTSGQCGDHGDVETMWGQHGDNMGTL